MTRGEAVNIVLHRFNFTRVHRIMKAMQWTWYNAVDDIPSVAELRATGRMLLEKVREQTSTSSGGLEAVWRDGELGLRFIPEHWDVNLAWSVQEGYNDDSNDSWERDMDDFYEDLSDGMAEEEGGA